MYGSRFYSSNFYSSGYYGGNGEVEEEEEVVSGGGYTGDGIVHTAKQELLKQIAQEDEIVVAMVTAFLAMVA